MELYHGSSKKIEELEARQAQSSVEVPKGELLNAVYLTPDYGFALACGVRVEGTTNIDSEAKTIEFEHPENFDPGKEVYIYRIESDHIPEGYLRKVDEYQYVVEGLKKLAYEQVDIKKAIEVTDFYKLINWEPKETNPELKRKFK
jgi:hypothetical protein